MRTEHSLVLILLALLVAVAPSAAAQQTTASSDTQKPPAAKSKASGKGSAQKVAAVPTVLDVEMTMIDGQKVNLKKYAGKVILVVNVASKCGFTGQYRPLQALHEKYAAKGFSVVAFPCNQFGKQEPKTEAEIDAFCKKRFGITFDMFSKTTVKGKRQAEFFKTLTTQKLGPVGSGDIKWNFEKFLIGKDGKPIARFASNVSPDSKLIVSRIEAALGIEAGEGKKLDPGKEKQPADKQQPSTDPQKGSDRKTDAPKAPKATDKPKAPNKPGSQKPKRKTADPEPPK